MSNWGSELGLTVLSGLSKLYTSLVWESTVLLALCSEDTLPPDCLFGKQDMEKLVPGDQVRNNFEKKVQIFLKSVKYL